VSDIFGAGDNSLEIYKKFQQEVNMRLIVQDETGSIGSLMVGRLGGVSVGVPDVNHSNSAPNRNVMLRPDSTASLPRLTKVPN